LSTIRAITVDPSATAHLTIGSFESPTPLSAETLVRVHAISLNRGEVRGAQNAGAGARPGWDIAGDVEQAAADGTGPKAGERVVGMMRTGAWAELVAIPSSSLAVLPDNVSFADASTLPVAGLTALSALDRADGLFERNVLVTGASGGVGIFGVQLAKKGGSNVIGLVRQERHIDSVKDAGADVVVADETGESLQGPFHHVLESVGGQVLGNVLSKMAPYGQIVCYGTSAGGPANFDSNVFLRNRINVSGMLVFNEAVRETVGVGLGGLRAWSPMGH
jgi:NADPH:quinone reductase